MWVITSNFHLNHYSADSLIEQPAIALLGKLNWETANIRPMLDLLLPQLVSREVGVENLEMIGVK